MTTTKPRKNPPRRSLTVAIQRGLATYVPTLSEQPEGRAVVLVPLDNLNNIPTKDELRMTPQEMEALCDSIRSEGLQQPILVPKNGEALEIVAGRHRAYAHKALGLTEIPTIIRHDMDDTSARVSTSIENIHRRNLSPYEEALGYQAILAVDPGLTQAKLAERVGVSPSTIKARMRLLQAGPILGPLAGRELTADQILQLIPLAQHEALARRVVGHVKKHQQDWMGSDVGWSAARALVDDKTVIDPYDYHFLAGHYALSSDEAYEQALRALPHVDIGEKDTTTLLVLDVKGAREALKLGIERLHEREARNGSRSRNAGRRESAQMRRQKRDEAVERAFKRMVARLAGEHLRHAMLDAAEVTTRVKLDWFQHQSLYTKLQTEVVAGAMAWKPEQVTNLIGRYGNSVAERRRRALVEAGDGSYERFVAAVHLAHSLANHATASADDVRRATGKTVAALKKLAAEEVDARNKPKGPAKPGSNKAKTTKTPKSKRSKKAATTDTGQLDVRYDAPLYQNEEPRRTDGYDEQEAQEARAS